jgi:3-hydroxyacyl-CoA dehydrogenase
MTDAVEREDRGDVAILRLGNPPVNAISHKVRLGLTRHLEQCAGEDRIAAIVLIGAGGTFAAGADIREFGRPIEEPSLGAVIRELDALAKPVVAAVAGSALGGGLELAMACHLRICTSSAVLGLPEVRLGVMPGGGGTQRLPRLVGMDRALAMMLTGESVSGQEAHSLGLADVVAHRDLLDEAVTLARAAASGEVGFARARDREAALEDGLEAVIERYEAMVRRRRPSEVAPAEILRSVRNAATVPFDEALKLERAGVAACLASPQSGAMRHLFFAERAARKAPQIAPESREADVGSVVGIVGSGSLARGLAQLLVPRSIEVLMWDESPELAEEAVAAVQVQRRKSSSSGSQGLDSTGSGRIGVVRLASELARAGLVIEATTEDIETKRRVLGLLGAVLKVPLATATPYFSIEELAGLAVRRSDFLGLHFFLPVHAMPLVEVVSAPSTAPALLATAMQFCNRIGKLPVLVQDCDGFVGDRCLRAYLDEAIGLLAEGVAAVEIDAALQDFGMALGPFRLCGMIGEEMALRILHGRAASPYDPGRAAQLREALAPPAGATGAGERAPASALRADRENIVRRCLSRVVNESLLILEENVVRNVADIDVIWANGLGFPRYRGGPIWWADAIGAEAVLREVRRSESWAGSAFAPAPLLLKAVAAGLPLRSL